MEATISAHGLKLFVREQGEGHPLVLINGIGADSEMWGSAERILAASSRTIVFDSPGTGRSETPLLPRSIPALARDHLRAARRARSRAGRPPRVLVRRRARAAAGEGCTRAAFGVLRSSRRSAAGAQPRVTQARSGAWSPTGGRCRIRSAPRTSSWRSPDGRAFPGCRRYSHRRSSLRAQHDEFVPATNAEQLARHLPNSSLHLLPGAEHLCMFDPAGAGARLLADFFSSETLDASEAWTDGLSSGRFRG